MRIRSMFVTLVLAVAACGSGSTSTGPTVSGGSSTRPLYDRLGGKDAITRIVDDFIANVAADVRINAFFANADVPNLKAKLVDQICEASGGPCKYTGKTMKDSHVGMGVSNADFTALVEDLTKALDTSKVAAADQAELLAKLGAMKGDIVTK